MNNCIQDSFKNKKTKQNKKKQTPPQEFILIKIKIKPHNLQGATLALTSVAERDLKVNS